MNINAGLIVFDIYILSSLVGAYNYFSAPPEVVCPCQYRYNPVCGSDGLTYFNPCILECINKDNQYKGLQALHEQSDNCAECICKNVNLPVCALDGTTYTSECEIDCVNRNRIRNGLSIILLAYRLPCNGPSCDCPTIASPVCGTNNVLYRNDCVRKCACKNNVHSGLPAIGFKNNGACLESCSCPITYQPVCGTDGVTYDNPCKLECENRHAKKEYPVMPSYAGRCNECHCDSKYDPVCASDGTTFENRCKFECGNGKRGNNGLQPLLILSKGKCEGCICEEKYDPVCGSDNETYSNECELKCKNRGSPQQLSVVYKGECRRETSICICSDCSYTYEPKCGDDYGTYWNDCWMKCYSDCNVAKGLKPIQLLKDGPCM